MKFKYLQLGILFLAASCNPNRKEFNTQENERPNIVFILTDDHAFQAISCYGSNLIETPNIDRLAKEGMRFEKCFVTNSICAPSRATILTGKHSHINGKIDNQTPFDTTNITFPQLLQESGYQTAMFGKLHFGNAPKGFDEFKILPGQGHYYNPDFITNTGDTSIMGYVTDIITELSIDWLENNRNPGKPFFLAYWHKAPHREWMPAPRHLGKLVGKQFPLPETYFDNYEGRSSAAKETEMSVLKGMSYSHDFKIHPDSTKKLGIPPTKKKWLDKIYFEVRERMTPTQLAKWDSVYNPIMNDFMINYPQMSDTALYKWKYQRFMEDYLGTIQSLDENIGRLMDYLKANKLDTNTIMVYTSDQGLFLGEHGWFDKRFMYEESFRTPLIVKWPGHIKPGSVSDHLVQNLDFAQTFLDMANLPVQDEMQGKSLVPIFRGKSDAWRDAVYYHYYEYPRGHRVNKHYGIRTNRYKLIHFYYDIDEWELYDLEKDPMELNNVYNNPEYSTVQAEHHQKLDKLIEEYKDPITDQITNGLIQLK